MSRYRSLSRWLIMASGLGHALRSGGKQIDALQGWRAIAAISVMIYHAGASIAAQSSGAPDLLLRASS